VGNVFAVIAVLSSLQYFDAAVELMGGRVACDNLGWLFQKGTSGGRGV